MSLLAAASTAVSPWTPSGFGLRYVLELVALVPILYFIVRKVAPPVRRWMDARREIIRAQLAAGEEAAAAVAALVEGRRRALQAAHSEASGIVEQAERSAEQIVEEARRQGAVEEHDRLVARAGTEIELAKARNRQVLAAEMGALVVDAAARIVADELDDSGHHRLIGEAITAAESEVVR